MNMCACECVWVRMCVCECGECLSLGSAHAYIGKVERVVWVESAHAFMLNIIYADGDSEEMTREEVHENAN